MNSCDHDTHSIREMMFGLDAPVKLQDGRLVPAINLDNAATTPPFKRVCDAIARELQYYGSIGRGKGQKSAHATEVYTRGRATVKDFLGAADDRYEVIYTNCTTDGMNKLASALVEGPDDIVLSTRMEHHANDLPWRERCHVVYAEVDALGRLIPGDIERLLAEHGGRIKYVTVTAASNVTGYVNDVHAIARIAHRHGARIVVDGAQIVAHRPFSLLGAAPEEHIDFFVCSAHKMYSPFGGGAIVGLADVLNQRLPAFYGGGMVDAVCDDSVIYSPAPDRYEAGSPNYPGVVGMLTAMETLRCIGFDYVQRHEQRLLRMTLDGLASIPGVRLYGDSEHIADRVGIAVFTLDGMPNLQVADQLAARSAIAVRHAAFCAHPYVRRLTNEPERQPCVAPAGMVRVSFGIYNDECDVDCLLSTVCELSRAGKPATADRIESNDAADADRGKPNDRG